MMNESSIIAEALFFREVPSLLFFFKLSSFSISFFLFILVVAMKKFCFAKCKAKQMMTD